METKLTEQLASNNAIDVIASALIALPGGEDALAAAVAAHGAQQESEADVETDTFVSPESA